MGFNINNNNGINKFLNHIADEGPLYFKEKMRKGEY
jgi:hypothetical protein